HGGAAVWPPRVHVSTSRRAEVALFGEDPFLVPPFSFRAGEFTVTTAREDQRCTLSRLSVQHGIRRRQCSLKLDDVLQNLADLGATYPEVVEFLRQAGSYRCLSCPVVIDALPQAVSVFDLAKDGALHPELLKTDADILKAKDEFGATPTLYETTQSRKSSPSSAQGNAAVPPDRNANGPAPAAPRGNATE